MTPSHAPIHPLDVGLCPGRRPRPWRLRGAALLFAAAGLAGAVCAHASAPCIDYSQVPSVRDRLLGDGAVLVANGHAYTGHLSRLLVHDVSTSPASQVAELDLESGSVRSLARSGDVLYAATVQGGIAVVAIVDPEQPVRVTSLALPGEPGRVRVDGARLYVEDRRATAPFYHFRIFDITTPTNPQPLGSTTLPFAGAGFALENDHAYVAMTNGGMQVIDIALPNAPVIRGQFFVPGIVARDVAVRGDRAWLTSSGSDPRVYVLDISNAMAPESVGDAALPDGGWGIVLDGDNAYVATGGAGIARLDIAQTDVAALV